MLQYLKRGLFTGYTSISLTGFYLYGIPYSKNLIDNVYFVKKDMNKKELIMEYIGYGLTYGSVLSILLIGSVPLVVLNSAVNNRIIRY